MANLALRNPADGAAQLLWLDRSKVGPRLALMVARASSGARDDVARVFVRSRSYPFDERGRPILDGLDPGFVTDMATGAVFAPGTPMPSGASSVYLYTTPVQLIDAAPGGVTPRAIPLGVLIAETGVEWVREAQRLRTQLNWSVAEIGAARTDTSDGTRGAAVPSAGDGVIIGIADYGMDFAHPNFRHGPNGQGGTRLLALWDQNGPGQDGMPRGRVMEQAVIDTALGAPGCPYASLGYHPHDNYYTDRRAAEAEGAHGTHVLDIAAGNGAATGLPGVAPRAELVFVQLPAFNWRNPGDLAQGAWVYEAAAFVFDRASKAGKPAVLNLSLTTNTGTHDGTNPVELALAALLRAPGRAIVVCAGNERTKRTHSSGLASPGSPASLVWRQPARDAIPNQLLLCHDGDQALTLTLTAPGDAGSTLAMPSGEDGEYELMSGDSCIGTVVTRHTRHPGAHPEADALRQVTILMPPDQDAIAEDWRLTLSASGGTVRFHAWIERDDPDQSYFPMNAAPGCTLGSLASCDEVIVVGAYDALAPLHRPAATFSSEGPTRDGRQKPDLVAPGVGILAARSTHGQPQQAPGRRSRLAAGTVGSGTSQAAPHVTGAAALLFAAAGKRGLELRGTDIRDLLRNTARRDRLTPGRSPERPDWDPHAGCGRLAVDAALQALPGLLGRPEDPTDQAAEVQSA